MPGISVRRVAATAVLALFGSMLSGCSGGAAEPTVTLGYFPNLTHAPAIVGTEGGYFAKALGAQAELKTVTFNAGPAAIEALNAGSVDIAFVGPNPTVTGFTRSRGQSLRVIAGAAANGAALVTRPEITSAAQLAGKKLATPQLGNTQDVALRYWLQQSGFQTTVEGGGDVQILPQDNATTLQAFSDGQIDGAWVPEPWASRLVLEAGGKVLVDEADLWPEGKFVVTNVVVRTEFLEQHPDQVKAVLTGLLDAQEAIDADPEQAKEMVNTSLAELTGKAMDPAVLDAAWENVEFTYDPLAATLREGAAHAASLGLLDSAQLQGLYALEPLNELIKERGGKQVSDQ